MKKIRLATVFSGIGAIEQTLKKMNLEHSIVFACDNGERMLKQSPEEINKIIKNKNNDEVNEIIKDLYSKLSKENEMKKSYFANYDISENDWYEDIRYLSAKKYKNKVDLFVGGSPCQSFSVNGKRAGFEDTRGTLFYEFVRIVKECEPKVFIYENVKGMLTHDNTKTWSIIKSVFNELDYNIYIKKDAKGNEDPILNSMDYGIPQNRKRIFVVGIRKDIDNQKFQFPKKTELNTKVADFLEKSVPYKYYLGEKGFNFVTSTPSRAQVGKDIMRCQKANQQFNWNGDFIFEPYEMVAMNNDILKKAYVSEFNNCKGVTRKFTPRECLRLMGFPDSFKIVVSDTEMYRQSGNSIVVNVLEALMKEIIKTGVID